MAEMAYEMVHAQSETCARGSSLPEPGRSACGLVPGRLRRQMPTPSMYADEVRMRPLYRERPNKEGSFWRGRGGRGTGNSRQAAVVRTLSEIHVVRMAAVPDRAGQT
jgi:hypothetical protein